MKHSPSRVVALLALPILLLAACGPDEQPGAPGIDDGPAAEEPPADDTDGVVEQGTDEGSAAAELVVEPASIPPDGEASVTVVNHGDVTLGYGRPISVERWDGDQWVRWEPADEVAWTMELLMLEAGQTGVEQTFPFAEEAPDPGWYRLTKQIVPETTGEDPGEIIVTARVLVE